MNVRPGSLQIGEGSESAGYEAWAMTYPVDGSCTCLRTIVQEGRTGGVTEGLVPY